MANEQEGKKSSRKKKETESRVIDFFNREENIPYNYKQVSAAIGAETPKQRALVVEVLEELALEGLLVEVNPGRFKAKSRSNVATGTFVRRSNGKNSVILDQEGEAIFVAERNSMHALNGDRVQVHISAQRKGFEPEAEVIAIIEKKDEEIFGPYIHMNGKIATIVILQGGDASVANGVSLNVTSCNPTYVYESEIPAEIVARETEIETEASKNDPAFAKKPEIIKQKIIEGRVRKNLCANVLASQPYVLDETKSVGSFLKENNATIVSFVRYAVGEGIEKKQSDFAAEVESQMKM